MFFFFFLQKNKARLNYTLKMHNFEFIKNIIH